MKQVTDSQKHEVRLTQAKGKIRDGDLLLFRGTGLLARLIRVAGRTRYSHAAKAVWWHGILFCCEVRELKGGRAVTLASQVRKYSGAIDVFAVNPQERWDSYDRQGAIRKMLALTGCDYGYLAVLKAALLHLPMVRLLVPPSLCDTQSAVSPPFCSAACATADRVGGKVDPVPHLADHLTEPGDLARSAFYQYRFTLGGE